MTTNMTADRWARATWHARQQYLAAQERRLRDVLHQIAALEARETITAARTEDVADKARRILDTLGPDPKAARHRAELLAALGGAA